MLVAQKKDAEWKRYFAELREEHKRKVRLLEVLDSIAGKSIVEG
jgi:uncharacterized Zn finger protein